MVVRSAPLEDFAVWDRNEDFLQAEWRVSGFVGVIRWKWRVFLWFCWGYKGGKDF